MSFPILKHISIILIILTFFNCTDNTWEQQGSHGVDNWPKVLTNGTEKYVFNYRDTTAIHYFDNENAEKIWFCKFRNPKKEVLKMRYVLKTQKHMVNGWIYSDELFDHTEWPMKISKNNESRKIRIGVFNTGDRIDESELQRIWGRFYKIDSSRNREKGGSGIGLAFVKAIMNNYKNEYGAINRENGIEFFFELNMEIPENS